ncbi:MAG: hypothetical protein WD469_02480 [Paenibacillaceae bacterium]
MSNSILPIAIIHHANQYLISNGYLNRKGLAEIIGPPDASSGLRAVLELHSFYDIPFHLHISGTLIEACAWFEPNFLEEIAEMRQVGLVEIIGSTYSQNIMTLFDREFNRYQIEEELRLIQDWLGTSPTEVTGFWIPERVWNTNLLTDVISDCTLSNGGFRYILADDRLLLPKALRKRFDENGLFSSKLFKAHHIKGGKGLKAVPLATGMRLNVPFESDQNESKLKKILFDLHRAAQNGQDLIAIYGDDMEKSAGIPPMWNSHALEHYQRFLQWLASKQDVSPVLLQAWLQKKDRVFPTGTLNSGSYMELATQFGAGEDYLGWAESAAWIPFQEIFVQAWRKLKALSSATEKESSLLELARKHLMACTYETAWHDPVIDPDSNNGASNTSASSWIHAIPAPWARALSSHARSAYVLMEAHHWAQNTDQLYASVEDLDTDGYEEVILRNDVCAVVISPNFGGRILYMFYFQQNDGVLTIGNPSDDWNLLEEINDFMDSPMNHPGALADYGYEHDAYEISSLTVKDNDEAELVMINNHSGSAAFGLTKRISLFKGESRINICYESVPQAILPLSMDIGCSPDYLRLLREGRSSIVPSQVEGRRGFRNGSTFIWVYPKTKGVGWNIPRYPIFGHGFCLGLVITSSNASFSIGVDSIS